MKKKYTQEDIDQFFGNFKELPDYFELEKVHQLIDNPAAKATQPGNHYFKPYKFLFMTSTIITLVATLLLWPEDPSFDQKKELAQTPSISVSAEVENKEDNLPIPVIEEEEESKKQEKERNQTQISAKPIVGIAKKRAVTKRMVESFPTIKPKAENSSAPANKGNTSPADTVIDGSQFLITLTDEELEQLGFMLDETGIYYYNLYKGVTTSFYSRYEIGETNMGGEITSLHDFKNRKNKKNDHSYLDFYPLSMSDKFYRNGESSGEFDLKNDTLVPVVIKTNQLKYPTEDQILWFKISEKLFKALPKRYQTLSNVFKKILQIKRMNSDVDVVKYETKSLFGNLNFVELSGPQLKTVGFKFEGEKISFSNLYEDGSIILKISNTGSISVVNTKEHNSQHDHRDIEVLFLSDTLGKQSIRWQRKEDDENKMSFSYFQERTQLLIPFLLRQSAFPDILQQDQIFWFKPSEELFNALPSEIGSQLRQEYNYLTANNEEARKELSSSCTFFEACKASLQLNKMKLFPNPAASLTTLSFEGTEENIGTISLVNISGTLVKELVPRQLFQKGFSSFQFDLSGISPGMYLVSINTDKGFKTQRLIITR